MFGLKTIVSALSCLTDFIVLYTPTRLDPIKSHLITNRMAYTLTFRITEEYNIDHFGSTL